MQLLQARLWRAQGELDKAAILLQQLRTGSTAGHVGRQASFELAAIEDQRGHHAQAWTIASEEHQRSTLPYSIEEQEQSLRLTAEAARHAGPALIRQASRRVEQIAFLMGLPRSGTSLLEQMLDRHGQITGIGETAFPGWMADAIAAEERGWPSGAQQVSVSCLNNLQDAYNEFVRLDLEVPLHHWSVDKTVFPMTQPLAIACVLPGATMIRITRDPLDTIVSIFLANMEPSWGWTGSVESILRMIYSERMFVPIILESLEIPHLLVEYESLVEQPRTTLTTVLEALGLPLEEACLHPERNQRVVMTLSHDQVRQPIHANAIGRWQNYEQFLPKALFTADTAP
ncbi:MAG: sulfotransferase [Synechococcaceae cyanobacterium]|nr:sulfotransferase [Synechococcaceae cyanobacterium]